MVSTAKTVEIPPTAPARTVEEVSLLESVDDRVVGEGGVMVDSVPIETDKYMLERALAVVRDGGADRLAHCLTNMPGRQAAALIAIEFLRQSTS